ncbi:MAG: hypothetical protein ACLRMJ_04175 [Alistipes finegoldii]
MLSLKRMEDTLGDEFATAVEMILGARQVYRYGYGQVGPRGAQDRRDARSTGTRASFSTPAKPSTALGAIPRRTSWSRSIRARRTKSSRDRPLHPPTATSWFR